MWRNTTIYYKIKNCAVFEAFNQINTMQVNTMGWGESVYKQLINLNQYKENVMEMFE